MNLHKDLKTKSESKYKKFFISFNQKYLQIPTETNTINFNTKTKLRKDLESFDDFRKKQQETKLLNKVSVPTSAKSKNLPISKDNMVLNNFYTNSNIFKTETNFFQKSYLENANNQRSKLHTAESLNKFNNFNKFKNMTAENNLRVRSPQYQVNSETLLNTQKNEETYYPYYSTFSDFNEKTKSKLFYNTNETESNGNQEINIIRKIEEKDIKNLINFFYHNSDEGMKFDDDKIIEIHNILKKFNLNNNNPDYSEEEIKIKKILKNNKKISNANPEYNIIYSNICKNNNIKLTRGFTNENLYKNPISSLKKLDLNKTIYNRISNVRETKINDLYLQNYFELTQNFLKKLQMKKIKKTDMNLDTKNEEIYDLDTKADMLNEQFDIKSPIIRQLLRDKIFSEKLEFSVNYTIDNKIKPFARSQYTGTIDDGNLYIFGGISGEILSQIWVCDLKSNYYFFRTYPFLNVKLIYFTVIKR